MKPFWILLILLNITSCCSTKKASRTIHTQTEQQNDLLFKQSSLHQQQESLYSQLTTLKNDAWRQGLESALDEQLQVHIRVYDTDKPLDSLSGKRPLLADLTLQRKQQSTGKASLQQVRNETSRLETAQTMRQTDSLQTQHLQNSRSESETHTQEHHQTRRRPSTVILIVTIAGIVALGYYLRLHTRT